MVTVVADLLVRLTAARLKLEQRPDHHQRAEDWEHVRWAEHSLREARMFLDPKNPDFRAHADHVGRAERHIAALEQQS